jgi:hypothetical protein
MAIGKSITKFGITLLSACHRIEWMNLNLLNGNNSLEVKVATYDKKGGELIDQRSFVLPGQKTVVDAEGNSSQVPLGKLDKANVSMRYAYLELAKLPEFEGGIEV